MVSNLPTHERRIIVNDHKTVSIPAPKPCDFCGCTAKYDGKTIMGPWANMCSDCFAENGIGLGLGMGQELIVVRS
jgi:hypothetical protein